MATPLHYLIMKFSPTSSYMFNSCLFVAICGSNLPCTFATVQPPCLLDTNSRLLTFHLQDPSFLFIYLSNIIHKILIYFYTLFPHKYIHLKIILIIEIQSDIKYKYISHYENLNLNSQRTNFLHYNFSVLTPFSNISIFLYCINLRIHLLIFPPQYYSKHPIHFCIE